MTNRRKRAARALSANDRDSMLGFGTWRHDTTTHRPALTLVEVVVSIALAGSLLASVVLVTGRHLRQLKRADQSRRATVLLDQFLSQWSLSAFKMESFAKSIQAVEGISEGFEIKIAHVKFATLDDTEVVRISVTRADNVVINDEARSPQPILSWAEVIRSRQREGS